MKKSKETTKSPVVYCGPTIPRVAKSFTAYAEIPKALEAKAEQCPAILALTVGVELLADTRMALKTPGSRQANLYQHIQNFLKGGI